jgi:hypothetical protein
VADEKVEITSTVWKQFQSVSQNNAPSQVKLVDNKVIWECTNELEALELFNWFKEAELVAREEL